MKKRLLVLCALATTLTVAISGVARADTTLGTTAVPSGMPGSDGCGGDVIAQLTSDPSTPYTVPSPGTITSWRIRNFADPGTQLSLVVLKNTGGISYSVVGVDTHTIPNSVSDVLSFTVGSPIAVSGGEILALWEADDNVLCYWSLGDIPGTDVLIALDSATTPTTGQSLTQAGTDSGGGYRLNLEANLTPPAPTPPAPPATPKKKKKCKKKKHKRSAESAKKKCKKKKKR
jgi:hypothetical protein